MQAASVDGDADEVPRIPPLLERARKRWIAANYRLPGAADVRELGGGESDGGLKPAVPII
jgi:hypothetical protein